MKQHTSGISTILPISSVVVAVRGQGGTQRPAGEGAAWVGEDAATRGATHLRHRLLHTTGGKLQANGRLRI